EQWRPIKRNFHTQSIRERAFSGEAYRRATYISRSASTRFAPPRAAKNAIRKLQGKGIALLDAPFRRSLVGVPQVRLLGSHTTECAASAVTQPVPIGVVNVPRGNDLRMAQCHPMKSLE